MKWTWRLRTRIKDLTTKMASVSARCRNEVDLAPSHSNLDEEVGRGEQKGMAEKEEGPE